MGQCNLISPGDDEERTRKLKLDLNQEFNKDVKLENVSFVNVDKLTDTASIDYRLTLDNFTSTIVGMNVFKIPWTVSYPLSQIFSSEKRKYPLELWFLTAVPHNKETIAISFPQGKKLVERPKDFSISCSAFNYSVKYEIKTDKIIATRELTYLKDVIMPDEYEEVKKVASEINEADTKELAFK